MSDYSGSQSTGAVGQDAEDQTEGGQEHDHAPVRPWEWAPGQQPVDGAGRGPVLANEADEGHARGRGHEGHEEQRPQVVVEGFVEGESEQGTEHLQAG